MTKLAIATIYWCNLCFWLVLCISTHSLMASETIIPALVTWWANFVMRADWDMHSCSSHSNHSSHNTQYCELTEICTPVAATAITRHTTHNTVTSGPNSSSVLSTPVYFSSSVLSTSFIFRLSAPPQYLHKPICKSVINRSIWRVLFQFCLTPQTTAPTEMTGLLQCCILQSRSVKLTTDWCRNKRHWQKLRDVFHLKLAFKVGKLLYTSLPSITWGPAWWHVCNVTLIKRFTSRHKEYVFSSFFWAQDTQLTG